MVKHQNEQLERMEPRSFVKPNYTVRQEENAYHVDVFMPGTSRADASITLDGDTLSIEARRADYAREGWKPLHQEIRDQDYKLHLQLNVDIDPERITAKAEDGILRVVLPVAAKAAQRTITVS